jgi:hypothetical protein
MTRTLVAYALAAALLASSAHAQSPLPSQESRNFFGVRICRDRQILSAIKTLATSDVLAIPLEAEAVDDYTRSSAPTPEVYGPGAEDFHTKH